MSTQHRTPDEIERDIERERAGLTSTLDTLQEKFSVDHLVNQIGSQLRDNGGEISRSVARSVKENPVALAVAGIGLAWLIFGKGQSDDTAPYTGASSRLQHDQDRDDTARSYPRAPGAGLGSRLVASADTGHDHANPYNRRHDGLTDAPRYRNAPHWSRSADHDDDTTIGDRLGKAGSSVSDAAGSARDGIANAGSAVGAKASDVASSAGDAVSSAAHGVADAARSGRDSVASGLSSARDRIAAGTETLSHEARLRVIAAREKAMAARAQADQKFRQASATASDFYEDQPLVAGLLAMAAGAAVAGALPRTQMEDKQLGAYSDTLMEEAEHIFRQEAEKAKAVVTSATDEASKIARETKDDLDGGAPGDKSAVQAIADKVKADGKRVANAAKAEADKQDLGKVKT